MISLRIKLVCCWPALLCGLAWVLAAVRLPAAPWQELTASLPVPGMGVACIGLTVSDADRSLNFFRDVLEFEVLEDTCIGEREVALGRRRTVRLCLGQESIVLTQYLDRSGEIVPADSRAQDHWFQHLALVVSDLPKAYSKLRAHKVRHVSSVPQILPAWNPDAGGIGAFYFRDPDGHFLELIHFPPGKGEARWQNSQGRLFLGIDHTAIVVRDTARSVDFYRDQLGMHVTGTSENWGAEQEQLNGVFGAHLLITGLRGQQGPGIELLEYLSPTDGRELTKPWAPDDRAPWEILFQVPGRSLSLAAPLQFDPDGHAFRICAEGARRE